MNNKTYKKRSWIDPRIEVRESDIEGKGLFVKETIKAGEVVEIFGGDPFTQEEINKGMARVNTGLKIDNDLYLALLKNSQEESIDEFTNHSCDPSCWLVDEVTLVARRDLNPGDEITMDYATWDDESGYIAFTDCKCATKFCRKVITGDDWKKPELQKRYKHHFSPFIEKKIKQIS